MAKKSPKKQETDETAQEPKKGLDVKVKLEKNEFGRITLTVSLLEDGEVVAVDYDFVNV